MKLAAIDLDGTFLTPDKGISEYSGETLRLLKQAGTVIVICSGRPYYSIHRLFHDLPFDYACCMNGQYVTDQNGNVLMHKPDLNQEEIDELSALLDRYPVILSYSSGNAFFHTCSPKHKHSADFFNFIYEMYHRLADRNSYHSQMTPLSEVHISSCGKFCFSGMPWKLKDLYHDIDLHRYSAVFVSPIWLEVQPAGISKGSALTFVQKLTGIGAEETCAVGDGENDLSMFAHAARSAAVANAMRRVKKAAGETAGSCRKDGAARWLREVFQISRSSVE